MPKQYILSGNQAKLKIERMVLEIAENNTDVQRIVVAGIAPHGSVIAAQVAALLPACFEGTIEQITIELDKRHPTEIMVSRMPTLADAVLLIVDDVSNTGKALTYALKPFLDQQPLKIQTLVLVARTHKRFPIQPDYVGLSLATTLQEYIDVEVLDGEIASVWMA